jgi:hypothetical protein
MAVQMLLRESGRGDVVEGLVSVAHEGFEAQADWQTLGSPETYLGYQQTQKFVSADGAAQPVTIAWAMKPAMRAPAIPMSGVMMMPPMSCSHQTWISLRARIGMTMSNETRLVSWPANRRRGGGRVRRLFAKVG